MIINFSIKNFGSIKNRQTVSFEADKTTHLEETYVLNAYKSGKLGATPNPGDHYIDLNE